MNRKGGSNTQNGRFPCKIALHLKKVCYKVYYCQRQSCNGVQWPFCPCKYCWWRRPLKSKFPCTRYISFKSLRLI